MSKNPKRHPTMKDTRHQIAVACLQSGISSIEIMERIHKWVSGDMKTKPVDEHDLVLEVAKIAGRKDRVAITNIDLAQRLGLYETRVVKLRTMAVKSGAIRYESKGTRKPGIYEINRNYNGANV